MSCWTAPPGRNILLHRLGRSRTPSSRVVARRRQTGVFVRSLGGVAASDRLRTVVGRDGGGAPGGPRGASHPEWLHAAPPARAWSRERDDAEHHGRDDDSRSGAPIREANL